METLYILIALSIATVIYRAVEAYRFNNEITWESKPGRTLTRRLDQIKATCIRKGYALLDELDNSALGAIVFDNQNGSKTYCYWNADGQVEKKIFVVDLAWEMSLVFEFQEGRLVRQRKVQSSAVSQWKAFEIEVTKFAYPIKWLNFAYSETYYEPV